ncbi:histone deacetylase family protein [Aureimonas sp. OT7]|uniref:histone deacetylase family protein n=1 Tax=Aureimonas sp. OT7 TaxID=2816454 RepID=UPI00177FF43F|nr:histone deacetylase family protein [Aureimonas sp. OT7]QOG06045.1 histone deacetylase family protein [Aureimonas sp. OT7]
MITIYAEDHAAQSVETEFYRGQWVEAFETPLRAERIRAAIEQSGLGPIVPPRAFGADAITAVHDPDMVRFLEIAWDAWTREFGPTPAYPNVWPPRRTRQIATARPGAELGRYVVDMSSPILAGTWTAARAAVDCALTGAQHIMDGEASAFALCRPPGHHAGRDYFGGYCFLNNAAIAAQSFLTQGAQRVAVLDIDYHHGNGTQDIFYERAEVLTASIHADPRQDYPYYIGFADETGEAAGAGTNLNLPLPWGTGTERWLEALDTALARIGQFLPHAVVVSLGVDTFKGDPISRFELASADYIEIGRRIAALGLPTLFVMEGGYATDALGVNVVNLLSGFDQSRPPSAAVRI